ncbi:trypsin delta-like [Teleopsis dalmanni]|uniref:trypsin delta-like n=1 Tax=Teleopsis dalmanni TaxID=139649 RepID=UPI0018CDF899|nr:trypsin delta-like [Teleopsis dalmanni]
MLKLFITLSVLSCALGAAIPDGMLPQQDGRIINGTKTTINNFPWQISLQRNGAHSCGGSIYSEHIIVTAAHCLQNVSPTILKVRAGSSYWNNGGMLSGVAAFINHEGYNSITKSNDISIIRLSTPLIYKSTIKNIPLATTSPDDGAPAAVSGWGVTTFGAAAVPNQLLFIDLNIISRSKCASSTYRYGPQIRSSMICAADAGKDACQGDSGGPLVSNGELVGVVSWGYACAYANFPGVYADVAVLRSWVLENVETI